MSGVSTVFRPTPELDAVIGFLNTYDELNVPKDVLTSVDVLRGVLSRHGLERLGSGLSARHLGAVRALREQLREVFLANGDAARVAVLNDLLAGARPELREDGDGWTWTVSSDRSGVAPLAAAFAGALAAVVAGGSGDRLGVCAADPCHCVFADPTRSRRQRYCCDLCNDRMASAAYRRRGGHD